MIDVRHVFVAALIVGAVLSAPTCAAAGTPTAGEVLRWAEAQRDEAQKLPELRGHSLRWRMEDFNVLDPGEVQELRDRVANHPEHPRRHELAAIEYMLKGGKSAATFELFVEGPGRWRFNSEYLPNGLVQKFFTDQAAYGDRVWQLGDVTLQLFETRKGRDGGARMLLGQERTFGPMLRSLLYGCMQTVGDFQLRFDDPVVDGARWRLRARRAEGADVPYTLEMSGLWSDEHNRGFLEKAVWPINGYAKEMEGYAEEYSGWAYREEIGMWVAGRVDQRPPPSGRIKRSFITDGFRVLPAGGVKAVTAYPSREKGDPIRGAVTAASVVDERRGEVTNYDEAGVGRTEALPARPRTGAPASWRENPLRLAGWGTLGVLVVVLVSIKAGVFQRFVRRGSIVHGSITKGDSE